MPCTRDMGFSERADFAAACVAEKIRFVGPSPAAIAMMGDKSEARRTATQLGVPVVPGSEEAFEDAEVASREAIAIGYPILLKALAGGGGRGMRVAPDADSFAHLFEQASARHEQHSETAASILNASLRRSVISRCRCSATAMVTLCIFGSAIAAFSAGTKSSSRRHPPLCSMRQRGRRYATRP